MCTALSYPGNRHYFGRNLDLEYAYREEVVVTPRNYPFVFRCGAALQNHYAMIGMATISEGYPLYYDATNEQGLSIAALNFPGNAKYLPKTSNFDNIAPFELIPWVLGQCKSTEDAQKLLTQVNVWHLPFSRKFPLILQQLHRKMLRSIFNKSMYINIGIINIQHSSDSRIFARRRLYKNFRTGQIQ
jgi:choloylglycine hydrolase